MCTVHSIQRATERTRYSGKSAERFIQNGIVRGKVAEDFSHQESTFLAGMSRDNCVAKAYNGYCLIISENGDCVTLYKLPEWFGKKRHYEGKTRIRNVKRYAAANSPYDLMLAY